MKQCRCQRHLIENNKYRRFLSLRGFANLRIFASRCDRAGARNQRHAVYRYKTLRLRRRYNFGIAWAAQATLVSSLFTSMESHEANPALFTGPLWRMARFEFPNEKFRKHTGCSSDHSYATASRSTIDRVDRRKIRDLWPDLRQLKRVQRASHRSGELERRFCTRTGRIAGIIRSFDPEA
jgi:hypothetical protein